MKDRAPGDYVKRLGEIIVASRKAKRISQQDLSDMIGISRPTMRSIEKGDSTVAIGHYIAALSWLGEIEALEPLYSD